MYRKRVKLNEGAPEASENEYLENDEEIEATKHLRNLHAPVDFSLIFEQQYWEKVWSMEQNLSAELMSIDFKKDKNIAAIYNPLIYAENVHLNFMRKFLKKSPSVLFLGMNPGLFGMCQTSASGIECKALFTFSRCRFHP